MVSIVMATYNGSKFLKEQIDSILGQTYQNFEIVICDDCSEDSTWQILQGYAESDKRFRIYQNNENLGFKKNFEKVIRYAKGDYIALSDQDDIWNPDHLELLLQEMSGNIQLVCGRPTFVDENNNQLPDKFDYLKMDLIPSSIEDHARHIFLGVSPYQGASMLIKKEFFDKALPIPEEAKFHDSWFAAFACFYGGLVYLDKPTMRYRRLDKSVTKSSKHISAYRRFFWHVKNKNYLKDRPVFIDEIFKRVDNLTPSQIRLLNEFMKIHKRKNTLIGRISSIPYRLIHFKAIYASSIWK